MNSYLFAMTTIMANVPEKNHLQINLLFYSLQRPGIKSSTKINLEYLKWKMTWSSEEANPDLLPDQLQLYLRLNDHLFYRPRSHLLNKGCKSSNISTSPITSNGDDELVKNPQEKKRRRKPIIMWNRIFGFLTGSRNLID